MESKPVFCLVTAMKCPHCTVFRQEWPEIRRAIEATGLVRVVDIEVNSTRDTPNPEKYPKDLARYIKWFPTFVLFTAKSWNAASPELTSTDVRQGKEAKLDGVVFNGVFNEKGEASYVPKSTPTKDNLIAWIQNEIKNDTGHSVPTSLLSSTRDSGVTTRTGSLETPISPSRIHTATPVVSATGSGTGTFYVPTAGSVCRLHFRPKNKG
jgi:hypothetical protein